MRAREIMTAHPRVVTAREPVSRAAEIMRDLDVGAVPVVDDLMERRLVGIVTDRDLVVRCMAHNHVPACRVGEHMTLPPLDTVSPDADVAEVMARMKLDQVRRVLVTEGERLVGIIAQADLALREGPLQPLLVEEVLERVSAPSIRIM